MTRKIKRKNDREKKQKEKAIKYHKLNMKKERKKERKK